MRYKLILAINRNSKLVNWNYFSRDILTLQGNFCHKEPSLPPLPVYIRASLNLMVLYGETRSGQGYKARYGNSILLENSSKPRTPRFPGRTASAVFERRVNAELSSQVFDESLSSLFAYTLTGVTRACYVTKFGKNISWKEKKRVQYLPNKYLSKYTSLRCESTRNNEVDRSISRFDKLPTHGEF